MVEADALPSCQLVVCHVQMHERWNPRRHKHTHSSLCRINPSKRSSNSTFCSIRLTSFSLMLLSKPSKNFFAPMCHTTLITHPIPKLPITNHCRSWVWLCRNISNYFSIIKYQHHNKINIHTIIDRLELVKVAITRSRTAAISYKYTNTQVNGKSM